MKPHTVTITIKDNPDCTTATIEAHFEPPMQEVPEWKDATPAQKAALTALKAITDAAKLVKGVELEFVSGDAKRTLKVRRDK